jgi:hypothetical protein
VSLKESAYKLTKAIISSLDRKKLQNVINDLQISKEQNDRSHFGYLARQQRLQFFGYLLIDANRMMNAGSIFSLPEITREERGLLTAAHETLLQLTGMCLKPIEHFTSEIRSLVDGYANHRYLPGGHHKRISIMDEDLMEEAAKEFHNHPAIKVLAKSLEQLKRHQQPFDFKTNRDVTLQFEKELKSVGPTEEPQNLFRMFEMGRHNKLFADFFYVMFSIISIKSSIEVLRQILYQAVLMDKPPLLSIENVFNISYNYDNLAAQGLELSYQWDKKAGFIEPGDVVLIKINTSVQNIDALCLTGGTNTSFSSDTGTTTEAEFWKLDDYLNPHSNLFKLFGN